MGRNAEQQRLALRLAPELWPGPSAGPELRFACRRSSPDETAACGSGSIGPTLIGPIWPNLFGGGRLSPPKQYGDLALRERFANDAALRTSGEGAGLYARISGRAAQSE